jgi:biopolymer transport protein ExbD
MGYLMHSFADIAQVNDTSLAVVAPGIAESLFTTAAGLVAAIPASVAYNKLASDFNGLSHRLRRCLARRRRGLWRRSMMPLDAMGGGDQGPGLQADINVTPFIDVMLVLLIIFMVTAPLMLAGVPLRLSKSSAGALMSPKEPFVISMDKDGRLYLGDEAVAKESMAERLMTLVSADPGRTVLVRCDRSLDYGRGMELPGRVGACGVSSLSLVSEGEQGGNQSAGVRP